MLFKLGKAIENDSGTVVIGHNTLKAAEKFVNVRSYD